MDMDIDIDIDSGTHKMFIKNMLIKILVIIYIVDRK
jgi:hypothetical protein